LVHEGKTEHKQRPGGTRADAPHNKSKQKTDFLGQIDFETLAPALGAGSK
jgi:hypothetical protein